MGALETFAGVLSALHDAALDGTLWPAASARIDDALATMGSTLLVGEGPKDDVRILFAASYWRGERRPELERDYLHNYHPWDERVPRVRSLPDSELVHVSGLYTDEERKTSRTYNEFLTRNDLHDSLNVRLDGAPGTHVTWAIADPARPGGWHADQLAMTQRLLPHVRQFVRIRQARADAEAMGSSLSAMLETPARESSTWPAAGASSRRTTAPSPSSRGATDCPTRTVTWAHGCPRTTPGFRGSWPTPCPPRASMVLPAR